MRAWLAVLAVLAVAACGGVAPHIRQAGQPVPAQLKVRYSPFLAPVARPVTTGSSRIGSYIPSRSADLAH
jgi:hypothetical protein